MWIWGKPGKSGPGNFYNQICSTLFTHVCLSSGGRKWVWGQKKRSFFLLQNVALSLALSFGFWTLQRVFDWFDLPIQLCLLQQALELVIDWSIDLQVLFWALLVFLFWGIHHLCPYHIKVSCLWKLIYWMSKYNVPPFNIQPIFNIGS